MKAELLKLLRNRFSGSDANRNRKVFVFLVCLLISFFTWLQINLSRIHTEILPVRINYINLAKRFGPNTLSDTLLVEVESNGYGLLKYKMREISVDSKKLKRDENGAYYFLPNNYTKSIGKQMGDNFKVVRALIDTIQINPRTN